MASMKSFCQTAVVVLFLIVTICDAYILIVRELKPTKNPEPPPPPSGCPNFECCRERWSNIRETKALPSDGGASSCGCFAEYREELLEAFEDSPEVLKLVKGSQCYFDYFLWRCFENDYKRMDDWLLEMEMEKIASL